MNRPTRPLADLAQGFWRGSQSHVNQSRSLNREGRLDVTVRR